MRFFVVLEKALLVGFDASKCIYTYTQNQNRTKKSAMKPVVSRLDGTFQNIQKKCIKGVESDTTFGGYIVRKNEARVKIYSEFDGAGNLVKETHRRFNFFDDDKGYLFRMNKEAVRLFKGCCLPKELSDSDVARMYRLSMSMQKESNLICYRSGNTLKPMSRLYMAKYLNISERQVTAFLNRMIKERLIGRVKVRVGLDVQVHYYINPIYFFNGKWLNHNLYWIFRKDLDAFLPMWVKERFSEAVLLPIETTEK